MTSGASAGVVLHGLAVFLGEQVRPAIGDKALSYRVRIAQHLAMSVALEIARGEAHDRAAIDRLAAILGIAPEPTPTAADAARLRADLDARLAAAIRDGADLDPQAVLAHLKASLRDELSVTNPHFDTAPDLP